MLKRAALAVVIMACFTNSAEATKLKTTEDIILQAAAPAPPENYQYRIIRLKEISEEIFWTPADTTLRAQTKYVIEHEQNTNAPLILGFFSKDLKATVSSVVSSAGVDSFKVYPDSMEVFFSAHSATGSTDTLTISFLTRKDIVAAIYPSAYPSGDDRYYSLGNCMPFPQYAQGLFTVNLSLTVPESLGVVAVGREVEVMQPDSGFVTHRWRTDFPDINLPAFLIDDFKIDRFTSGGWNIGIYHYGRPQALIDSLAAATLRILETYGQWYGPAPYSGINLVDNLILTTNAFSNPGMINLGASIFEDKSAAQGGASAFDASKVVAHELAHQWWGNKIHSLEHRTMMECFAELSAIQMMEPDESNLKKYVRNRLVPSALALAEAETDSPLAIEGESSARFYVKGPAVLYMLERIMGKEAFFQALAQFQQDFAYQETYLDDFFMVLGKYWPEDLGWFREQWFERPGIPSITVRQDIRPQADDYRVQLTLTQKTQPFNIPLDIGIFSHGSITPEIHQFWISTGVDTFSVESRIVPDSVVIDPESRTLIGITRELNADIMTYGDTPNSSYPYEIEIYLDSTRAFEYVKAIYSVDGQPADTILINPVEFIVGYGRFSIPPQPSGSLIKYYIAFKERSGVEQVYPSGASENSRQFRVTSAPDGWDQLYVTYETPTLPTSLSGEVNAFNREKTGVAAIDKESMKPLGRICGVGNRAPQLDIQRNRLVTYNRELNAVDIIDLNRWKLENRIELADSVSFLEISALNRRENIYYLLDMTKVLEIDLNSGQTGLIFESDSYFNNLGSLPTQMKLFEEKNILFLKAGGDVLLIDALTGEVKSDLKINHNEMPYLRRDGTLFTVGLRPVSGSWLTEGPFYLSANWFDIGTGNPELIRSLNSEEFELRMPVPRVPVIVGANAVDYRENPEILALKIYNPVSDQNTGLLWDLSINNLASWTFSRYSSLDFTSFCNRTNMEELVFSSGYNTSLTFINLETRQLVLPYFSPFTGDVSDSPIPSLDLITGLVLPEMGSGGSAGDVNNDGRMDIFDLLSLLKALGDISLQTDKMDLNSDGRIDIFDLLGLLKLMSN